MLDRRLPFEIFKLDAQALLARGLVRVRSRSAAIVNAVAIAGTIAIAVVTALLGFGVNREIGGISSDLGIAPNQVLLEDFGARYGLPPEAGQPVASPADYAAKEAEVTQIVPAVRFEPVDGFTAVPVIGRAGSAESAQNRIDELPAAVLVAIDSPTVRRVAHLTARGRSLLRSAGVVSNGLNFGTYGSGRSFSLSLSVGNGGRFVVPIAHGPRTTIDAVMTPARAKQLGLPTMLVAVVGTAPEPLTYDQRNLVMGGIADPYIAAQPASPSLGGSVQVLPGYDSSSYVFWRGFWTPDNLQRWFAIGALLFVLVVVAIGLLLGASEGRDESDVLDQLGVRPRTGRRMEATKAALLAFGGGVLALPAGFIPLAVVFGAVQKPAVGFRTASGGSDGGILYPEIVFPWITAIGIVVVIPLVAALGAWAASAIAQRAQAFRGTLAFDAD